MSDIDLDFQKKFYENLLTNDPTYIDAMIPLAEIYTELGEYKSGLEMDLKITQLCPTNPIHFYNLACSYSLLKNISKARDTLIKAIELGYHDLDSIIQDKDLDNLRQAPEFYKITSYL